MTAAPDDDIKQACLNEVKLIAEISAWMWEPDPDGPPQSAKVDALVPVIEAYIDANDSDDPKLLAAVESARKGLEAGHSILRGKMAEAMREMFSSGVAPVYIAAAFTTVAYLMTSSVGYQAISAMSEVVITKQQQLGDPQLPVEIVVELISEDSEKALDKVLRKYR